RGRWLQLLLTKVDVDQLRVFANIAVVRFGLIEVLNQVVPEVPFPHDLAASWAGWFDLHQRVGNQVFVPGQLRPAARGDRFLGRLAVMHNQEDIPIRKPGYVMMRQLAGVIELEIPDQLSVPRELLNLSANAWPRAEYQAIHTDGTGAKQMAILQQERTKGRRAV